MPGAPPAAAAIAGGEPSGGRHCPGASGAATSMYPNAGHRRSGNEPDGREPVGRGCPARRGDHRRPVGVAIADTVVGVNARDQRIRVLTFDQADGKRQRRPGAPRVRLLDDRVVRQTHPGQGGAAPRCLVGRGDHANRLTETGHPLHGGTEQGLAARGEGEQMLRRGPAAQRPQPCATPTRQHEDVQAHGGALRASAAT